jgi:hypothetical protein
LYRAAWRRVTPFEAWMRALELEHLANLRFSELARALRALSATYVERRHGLPRGAALSGGGKRAAFALFYAPLHYLTVRAIVQHLEAVVPERATIVDLGCGTGAAGAAWAVASADSAARVTHPSIVGIDSSAWALSEATKTFRAFGLRGRTRQADLAATAWPPSPTAIVAAFAVNELDETSRRRLLARVLDRVGGGDALLVVEPIARSVTPWWEEWRTALQPAGVRGDDWRFSMDLPAIVQKLDRAAGLKHREVTARSLWVGGRAVRRPTP